jgi:hypothetical protein
MILSGSSANRRTRRAEHREAESKRLTKKFRRKGGNNQFWPGCASQSGACLRQCRAAKHCQRRKTQAFAFKLPTHA